MTESEETAWQLSKDRKRLLQRLLNAKSCLTRVVRIFHSPWKFNFQARQLVSRNRKFVLQWKPRAFPERPISYENQQTSTGIVVLKEVKS